MTFKMTYRTPRVQKFVRGFLMKYFNYYLPLNFQIISYKSVLVKFWGAFKDLFNEILILYTVYSNSVSIESLFKYS